MHGSTIIFLPPTRERPAEPAPFLLDQAETIRLLRLESNADPYSTLKRYRDMGLLKATQVGRRVLYQLPDVLAFLKKAQQENPR